MSTIGPIERRLAIQVPVTGGTHTIRKTIKYDYQDKYQSKPRNHTKPLPYWRECGQMSAVTYGGPNAENSITGTWLDYHSQPARQRCAQTAYGKLVGKVKELQQGWGETLATRKQAFDMMLHRLGTLTLAARRLKRGDIPGMCRALGCTPKRHRSKLKNLSDTWLEYHFGWEPLYGDIYTACHLLSSDVPGGTLKGTGVESVFNAYDDSEQRGSVTGRVVVKLQGDYYVENPDKFLLNQLGLINPIGLAWELVPFSFVVDWFIPVGQFLGALTDFYGVGRANEFTTVAVFLEGGVAHKYSSADSYTSKTTMVQRSLGISVPFPTFKLFRGFSPTRGATAVALCVGALKSLK